MAWGCVMSDLRNAMEEYLALRRALGFQLVLAGAALHRFVSFLEKEGVSVVTTKLALRWATQPRLPNPTQWANRLCIVRRFALYRSMSDPRTEIPPLGLIPYHYSRKTPYLYSDAEIIQILKAAKKLPSTTGFRAETYSTLFGLLAVTGMRMSEGIHLNLEDVDLSRGLITINRTKFGKSRIVPVHPSTQRKLQKYIRRRATYYPVTTTKRFFISEHGTPLTTGTVRQTFIAISRQIGLRWPQESHGPRLHDLRHRFAVKILNDWYRADVDAERNLPKLATYLGHTHVSSTYWYLTATPELLHRVAKKLDRI